MADDGSDVATAPAGGPSDDGSARAGRAYAPQSTDGDPVGTDGTDGDPVGTDGKQPCQQPTDRLTAVADILQGDAARYLDAAGLGRLACSARAFGSRRRRKNNLSFCEEVAWRRLRDVAWFRANYRGSLTEPFRIRLLDDYHKVVAFEAEGVRKMGGPSCRYFVLRFAKYEPNRRLRRAMGLFESGSLQLGSPRRARPVGSVAPALAGPPPGRRQASAPPTPGGGGAAQRPSACASCGAPFGQDGAFCGNCGARPVSLRGVS